MTGPHVIYGAADVAQLLGVSNAAVSNYLKRHTDTPPAAWRTTDGRLYWDQTGMRQWLAWQTDRTRPAYQGRRRTEANRVVDELREKLTQQ